MASPFINSMCRFTCLMGGLWFFFLSLVLTPVYAAIDPLNLKAICNNGDVLCVTSSNFLDPTLCTSAGQLGLRHVVTNSPVACTAFTPSAAPSKTTTGAPEAGATLEVRCRCGTDNAVYLPIANYTLGYSTCEGHTVGVDTCSHNGFRESYP